MIVNGFLHQPFHDKSSTIAEVGVTFRRFVQLMVMKPRELEDRLITFSVLMITIAKELFGSEIGKILGRQLVRSGTSSALNYGEAQSAESRKDFIHKSKIVLKELRETSVAQRIILRSDLISQSSLLEKGISENEELIAIFAKSISTARKNMGNG